MRSTIQFGGKVVCPVQLSRPEFDRLLRQFEAAVAPDEMRRDPRVLTRRRLSIVTDPDDPARPVADVVLRDISPAGIAITHHTGMPVGKRFEALLPGPDGGTALLCVVRHCEMLKEHLFRIGAEFAAVGARA
jgi:hypothetical protein